MTATKSALTPKATATKAETKSTKTRKPFVRSKLGVFLSVIRASLQMTTIEWTEKLKMPTAMKYEGIEIKNYPDGYLVKVGNLIKEIAPKYYTEFLTEHVVPSGQIHTELLTEDQKELIILVLKGEIVIQDKQADFPQIQPLPTPIDSVPVMQDNHSA